MAACRVPRSSTCNRTSRRAPVVRLSSARWAAHGRQLRSHRLTVARDGGSHGLSPRQQRQPPSPSGFRSLIRGMSRSTPCLRLPCRKRRRRRRARRRRVRHPRHHRPSPRHRPQQLQYRRERRVQSRPTPLLQPLRPPHRSLQTIRCNRHQVRSTRRSPCGLPRPRLLPPNSETRLDDENQLPDNCRPGRRLRTMFVAPCGRHRRPTSPARSRPGHRPPPLSAGSSGGAEPFSVPQINRPGNVSTSL